MNPKLRVGIIGSGFMGKAHASCYAAMEDVAISMVSSLTDDLAGTFAKDFGVPSWSSRWEELVKSPKVDAVDIVVPNFLHKAIALACAENGKPFLVEKPLARSVPEGVEIVEAVTKRRLTAVYGENLRYSPLFLEAKNLIEQGAIGNPLLIRINELHGGPTHADWFWDASLCGGGAALDMGIHGIYVMEWFMGNPVTEVVCMKDVLRWKELCKNGAEDVAISILKFGNGCMGELANAWITTGGIDVRVEIFGTEGTLHIDESKAGSIRMYSNRGHGVSLEEQSKDRPHPEPKIGWSYPKVDEFGLSGHRNELRHFVDCVKRGADPLSTMEQGLSALEVIRAIYESSDLGRRILVQRSL